MMPSRRARAGPLRHLDVQEDRVEALTLNQPLERFLGRTHARDAVGGEHPSHEF